MKAYKGFYKNDDETLMCRSFIYEEGKTYKTDKAKLCVCGFHACLDPIECMTYYNKKNVVYHEVALDGVSNERDDDSKVVGTKITIGREIAIDEMIKISIAEFPEKYNTPRPICFGYDNWNYIKKDGTRLNDEEYDDVWPFNEGFACVIQNNKRYYIKVDGTRLNDEDYDHTDSFIGGFAYVKQNGKWFHINAKGERLD